MKLGVRRRQRASVFVRLLVPLIVVGVLAPGVAAADVGRTMRSTPLSPRATRGRLLGATPRKERIEFDLVLSFPHESELDAFVARVNDPASPDYHHYATAEQIGERFGLSDDALNRVRAWLTQAGLDLVESFPQRTTLRVAGPAGRVNRLFQIELVDRLDPLSHVRYHEPRGDVVVPAPLAGSVRCRGRAQHASSRATGAGHRAVRHDGRHLCARHVLLHPRKARSRVRHHADAGQWLQGRGRVRRDHHVGEGQRRRLGTMGRQCRTRGRAADRANSGRQRALRPGEHRRVLCPRGHDGRRDRPGCRAAREDSLLLRAARRVRRRGERRRARRSGEHRDLQRRRLRRGVARGQGRARYACPTRRR